MLTLRLGTTMKRAGEIEKSPRVKGITSTPERLKRGTKQDVRVVNWYITAKPVTPIRQ